MSQTQSGNLKTAMAMNIKSSRVQDVLVDAVHDEGDGAHHGGPEDGGVALVALAHLRRHVRHRVGRGVANLECKENA